MDLREIVYGTLVGIAIGAAMAAAVLFAFFVAAIAGWI